MAPIAFKRQRQSLLHFGVTNNGGGGGGGGGNTNNAAAAVVAHKPRERRIGVANAVAVENTRGAAREELEGGAREEESQQVEGVRNALDEAEHNEELVRALLEWYDAEHRVLPWRRNPFSKIETQSAAAAAAASQAGEEDEKGRQHFAYMVWVSETMLQQTQVSRVVEYWTRWMTRWPTLEACATTASIADVEEMWAGLGYYRRARLLLEGLQRVHNSLGGVIPTDPDALRAIPGIGEYTSAAIASIAFGVPVAAMDANLKRVIARMKCLADGAAGADRMQMSQSAAADDNGRAILTSCDDAKRRPGCLNQAMMELGARVCQAKSADCGACPVSSLCRAKATEDAARAQWKNGVHSGGGGDANAVNAEAYSGMRVLDIPARKEKKERKEEHYNSAIIVLVDPKTKPFIGSGSKVLLTRRGATAMPSEADSHGDDDENIVPSPMTPAPSPSATGSKGAGPLAGLWEFPSAIVSTADGTANRAAAVASIRKHLLDRYGVHLMTDTDTSPTVSNALRVLSTRALGDGEVKHVFSHMTWRVKPHLIVVEDVRGVGGGMRNNDECAPNSVSSSPSTLPPSDAVRWVGYSSFKPTSYTSLVRKLWKLVKT